MKLRCSNKGIIFEIDDQLAGKTFRCPLCDEAHRAPPREKPVLRPGKTAGKRSTKFTTKPKSSFERRPRRTPAPQPKKSKRGLIIIVLLLLLLGGGGAGGYFYHQNYKLNAFIEEADNLHQIIYDLHKTGRFADLTAPTEELTDLLKQAPVGFPAEKMSRFKEDALIFINASEVIEKANTALATAEQQPKMALQTLEQLAARRSVQKDAILLDVLKKHIEEISVIPLRQERKALALKLAQAATLIREEKHEEATSRFQEILASSKLTYHKRVVNDLAEYRALHENNDYASSPLPVPEEKRALIGQGLVLAHALKAAEEKSKWTDWDRAFIQYRATIRNHTQPSAALNRYAIEQLDNCYDKHRSYLAAIDMATPRGDLRFTINVLNRLDADSEIVVNLTSVRSDAQGLYMDLRYGDLPVHFTVDNDGVLDRKYRFSSGDIKLTIPWQRSPYVPLLLAKPVLNELLQQHSKEPLTVLNWQIYKGPGEPIALGKKGDQSLCLFRNQIAEAKYFTTDSKTLLRSFRDAGRQLHDAVMEDATIPEELRQTLSPVINGTYGQLDPRDYLNGDYCRRLIQDGYLERHLPEVSPVVQQHLKAYRDAFGALQRARSYFQADFGNGVMLTALRSLKRELQQSGKEGGDFDMNPSDPNMLSWRITEKDKTIFATPMPERGMYSLYIYSEYAGKHETQPEQEANRISVRHSTEGELATFTPATKSFSGDTERWDKALGKDVTGIYYSQIYGTPAWSFPVHVPIYKPDASPAMIATAGGVVRSPDFSSFSDDTQRRAAQEAWLDHCVKVLTTPGELSLLFRHFSVYCLDSPIPTQPGLIGSNRGSGDFHQTVYQFLDRKISGRFVGDCDDLAEFFVVLTRKLGKHSQMFSLPRHAACGYVEETNEPNEPQYRLIFLQTGPPLIFTNDSLHKLVEQGFRYFDQDGTAHFTTESVPYLFRFANEQTRTTYLLSDRILVDPEYAEIMIRVQSYWHYHYYSTAIHTMQKMLEDEKNQAPANYGELASLYERVGLIQESLALRNKEQATGQEDEALKIHALMGKVFALSKLHDKEESLKVLREIAARMKQLFKDKKYADFQRTASVRNMMVSFFIQSDQPGEAFDVISTDLMFLLENQGHLDRPRLASVVSIYSKIRMMQEMGQALNEKDKNALNHVTQLILPSFTFQFFKPDDTFSQTLYRYSLLGSFAIARMGWQKGVEKLVQDGPYVSRDRNHAKRRPEITEEDWAWFRTCPALYAEYIGYYVDKQTPELFDPPAALPLIAAMERSYSEGKKHGSMVSMEGVMVNMRILEAILKKDKARLREIFSQVRDQDWSSYYDDAATSFGGYCGFIPKEEFPAWMEIFHQFFPGKQHYFKVAYRALDQESFDHALMAAEAAARFFPNEKAMEEELNYMRKTVAIVRQRAKEKNAENNKSATGDNPAEKSESNGQDSDSSE